MVNDAPRPQDDALVPMVTALRWQRDVVASAGSPVAAEILQAAGDDALQGGVLAAELSGDVRFGDFPGLRVMSAVHRLALERQAPRVAMRLPTLGGTAPVTAGDRAAFRREVISALAADLPALRASLGHTPQTNDPGRAALLRCRGSRRLRQARCRSSSTASAATYRQSTLQQPRGVHCCRRTSGSMMWSGSLG